jgi:hypothetical protein
MSDSLQPDLLGYVLDALEPDERQALETRIERDPRLADQVALIRRAMAILDDGDSCEPPAGLAARTCALVEREREAAGWPGRNQVGVPPLGGSQPAKAGTPTRGPAEKKGAREPLSLPGRAWRAIDIAAALACCVALAALIFPLINASRASSQITACANNLRELGVALTAYSEHHNGMFPQVPERGNLGAAGVFGPTLVDAGYLRDPRTLVCPGSLLADRADFHIPTLDELRSAKADRLKELQRDMGGSYGYALGYRDNGIYKPTRNLRRETFAIAADMPAEDLTTCAEHQTSPNHGWSGHNVLLEGGRVVYLKTCRLDGSDDNFFLNDQNQVAAGCHVNDAVIARSNARP